VPPAVSLHALRPRRYYYYYSLDGWLAAWRVSNLHHRCCCCQIPCLQPSLEAQ
jgi:hypothetical protein